jgi:hypothetical protein
MSRKGGSSGVHHTTRQKGTSNRTRTHRSTYSIKHKGRDRDVYVQYKSITPVIIPIP